MESYIIRREEHTTDKPFYTLKEDLLVMAKQTLTLGQITFLPHSLYFDISLDLKPELSEENSNTE